MIAALVYEVVLFALALLLIAALPRTRATPDSTPTSDTASAEKGTIRTSVGLDAADEQLIARLAEGP